MTEVLQANIFFMITSVAVIIFSMLLCVLLYQVIKIVKSIRRIVARVESGSEILAEDLSDLRANFNPANILQFIMQLFSFGTPKRRRRDEDES